MRITLNTKSADMFLGVPFNVAQYAMFTEMLAAVHGFRARRMIHHMADAHIYNNLRDEVDLVMSREIKHDAPELVIEKAGEEKSITDIRHEQISVSNYESWPGISTKGKVAV